LETQLKIFDAMDKNLSFFMLRAAINDPGECPEVIAMNPAQEASIVNLYAMVEAQIGCPRTDMEFFKPKSLMGVRIAWDSSQPMNEIEFRNDVGKPISKIILRGTSWRRN
jgi:hypothetical protein